jgi:hypothetical protein
MTATGEEQGGTTHCPKIKMNDKKIKQVPILLSRVSNKFSDAKKILKKCHSGQLR